jgi:hypothetical protein
MPVISPAHYTPEFDKSRDERKKVGLPTSRPIIALSACD